MAIASERPGLLDAVVEMTGARPEGRGTLEMMTREQRYPLGAAITPAELDLDPHPALARLREREPVSWLPCLDGWLVTRHDLAVAAMRDPVSFTVDDPRFSTSRVLGPSMLSLDGPEHARHRAPFVAPFRPGAVAERFAADTRAHAARLLAAIAARGGAELRREFAGPIAAATIAGALGLAETEIGVAELLDDYDAIVASVDEITAGGGPTEAGTAAFAALRARLESAIEGGPSLLGAAAGADGAASLSHDQIAANAAVLLFGGIETTEGMIANAALELLRAPGALRAARADPDALDRAIEESLRLEPAAAVIDRYCTAETTLGGASIARGELVRISLAGANRDPAVFADPDRFDPDRANLRRHLAFARGPHVCVGVHLARLEARTALATLIATLPRLRLDPERPAVVRGLVFRKPRRLDVRWD